MNMVSGGVASPGEYEHCTIGAATIEANNDNEVKIFNDRVVDYLFRTTGVRWTDVPTWNDDEDTTEDVVRETLLGLAKEIRNGESDGTETE